MNMKNQSRFTIFALLIVGVALISFVGLNFIIDKISKIPPIQTTMQARPPVLPVVNPALHKRNAQGQNNIEDENIGEQGPPDTNARPTPRMPAARNIRKEPEVNHQAPAPRPAPMPHAQQGMPPQGYNMMPDPSKMSPEEREAFEREMMRRQQIMQQHMMQQQQEYGPDYPMPPYYQNPYDNGHFEDDYDYEYDYRGKKEDPKRDTVKVSDSAPVGPHGADFDSEEDYDPDDYLHDDYLVEDDI